MLTEFKFNYWGERREPHPMQVRDIVLHHLRVDQIVYALDGANVSLAPRPNQVFVNLTHWGALTHDLGKQSFPYFIHEATKREETAKRYEWLYNSHPTETILRLGGELFVKREPLLANLIYHHHPELLQHQIPGLNQKRPSSPAFDWALTYLIVADGIAAANEPERFYNLDGAALQEKTIRIFNYKLTRAGLSGIIDIPKAVTIGYQAFNRLGF